MMAHELLNTAIQNLLTINRLNNYKLGDKGLLSLRTLAQIKHLQHLEGLTSEIFTLVLMVNGTENHGKTLMNENIDKKYYFSNYYDIALTNVKLNVKLPQNFGKIKAGLILQILMDGCNSILNIGQVEDL